MQQEIVNISIGLRLATETIPWYGWVFICVPIVMFILVIASMIIDNLIK